MSVRRISPIDAAIRLRGLESLDPRGMTTRDDIPAMTRRSHCFELESAAALAVYVVSVHNGVAWVEALHGVGNTGEDLVQLVDAVLCDQAQELDAIALQTRRRGLVRKLQRLGYRVTGWVLRKELRQ